MSIPEILLSQVAISLLVVLAYHLWVSRKKRPAPAPPATLPLVATPPAAAAPVEKAAPTPPVAIAPVATAPKAPPAAESPGPETLAVIAAAIAVVLDRSHRVVSVQPAAADAPAMNVWALEGRVEHFLSHKIR
jgi:hypothetical protein